MTNMEKRVIELFSGNADITKALIAKGIDCVSLDYDINKNPMICADVYKLDNDFLGRCKMPPRLIDDICKAVAIAVKGSNHD